ncbi:MAG: hypothetical protein P4L50_30195 [Anaerolineaceae bacterium]|nr:hypothetical protein [Anaerolineaceae bacterium]
MGEIRPSAEFEKKLQAAASAPAPDPQFVSRLRSQIASHDMNEPIASGHAPSAWETARHFIANLYPTQGNKTMRSRLMLPALLAVVLIAVASFFVFNQVTPVSAQQILQRATAVQSATKPAQGIWHTRIQDYQVVGLHPGIKTIIDTYEDLSTGPTRTANQASALAVARYRTVITDTSGKVLEVYSNDGSFIYSTDPTPDGAASAPLMVSRQAIGPNNSKGGQAGGASVSVIEKSLFDQFIGNPHVKLQGKETWTDGSQAYVLVDQSYQTQKSATGQDARVYTGSMTMVFNAQNYHLLASETTTRKNGQDVVIASDQYLLDEVLPADSPVAWDLSDLKGITIADQPKAAQTTSSEAVPVVISEQDLAGHLDVYLLKAIPAGLAMEIVAAPNQPKDQPYTYEVNYRSQGKDTFGLQAVGTLPDGFVETNFYDGSYKTAAGLVLHYSPSGADKNTTSAMLSTPDGANFLLFSTLPRDQVQALAETLVQLK